MSIGEAVLRPAVSRGLRESPCTLDAVLEERMRKAIADGELVPKRILRISLKMASAVIHSLAVGAWASQTIVARRSEIISAIPVICV